LLADEVAGRAVGQDRRPGLTGASRVGEVGAEGVMPACCPCQGGAQSLQVGVLVDVEQACLVEVIRISEPLGEEPGLDRCQRECCSGWSPLDHRGRARGLLLPAEQSVQVPDGRGRYQLGERDRDAQSPGSGCGLDRL
jgi:hypothetical protein